MSLTPGYWRVDPTHRLCIESATHGNIGIVNLARASEEDARLMAAAPELLAALREASRWIGHGECSDMLAEEYWTTEYRTAVVMVKSALAGLPASAGV